MSAAASVSKVSTKISFSFPNPLFTVRDLWKKRYFEEKKKTNPLEEQVNRLRGQLDQQHRKLLSHLEGRGAYQKGAPRINAPPSKKVIKQPPPPKKK